MLIIPVTAVPAQSLSIQLAGQSCGINLYSLQTPGDILATPLPTTEVQGYPALYMDLTVNGTSIINCRIVRNTVPMLLDAKYYGVIGDFVVVDMFEDTDPVYTGLGTQYQLVYLEASDLP